MKLLELRYFARETLRAEDFDKKDRIAYVNPEFILSIEDLYSFKLPMSGTFVAKYAVVTMSNNENYCIREEVYLELKNLKYPKYEVSVLRTPENYLDGLLKDAQAKGWEIAGDIMVKHDKTHSTNAPIWFYVPMKKLIKS